MAKLTAMDTEGFSLEEEEGSEMEEGEEIQRNEGDQDCTEKQVICIEVVVICTPPPHPSLKWPIRFEYRDFTRAQHLFEKVLR